MFPLRPLSFLRLSALSHSPLDPTHVNRVNQAELEFWKRIQGANRVGTPRDMLFFDCGGRQV